MAMAQIELYICLTADQANTWGRDKRLRAGWFGHGGSIPLKKSVPAAAEAYEEVHGREYPPMFIAKVVFDAAWFLGLVNEGILSPQLHVDGYRLHKDIFAEEPVPFCSCWVHDYIA